ncbi:putative quinol monooxygenase [Mucilaginibacter psychrotolerans]|uniref:Antibiotic biosynthesis monooxygenase n=1 Tax=Mucilaginibacter psychrotolerans TaxID=1524096 RepID=A0A4Y8S8J7_9SPHI|nr:antibiotic biosynthesis monooxygenase [Mucilaginibacter psychrotolerans]TFF34754.1 antibiotic biosynthesis monooxygenase [Mucilaginibacter psychrotolerans]
MIKAGLLVKLTAKAGKEQDVADFLESAVLLLDGEPLTVNWFAYRISESTFGIFDTFEGDEGRQAHLAGKVAEALMANAPHLLALEPSIEPVEILASK